MKELCKKAKKFKIYLHIQLVFVPLHSHSERVRCAEGLEG